MEDTVPIWSSAEDSHWVWLQWHEPDRFSAGGVSWSGQILRRGEYEYSFLVRPEHVPALWAAFGVPMSDDHAALGLAARMRYDEVDGAGVQEWLAERGIPCEVWSRVEED